MKKVMIMAMALMSLGTFAKKTINCEFQNYNLEIVENHLLFQDVRADKEILITDFSFSKVEGEGVWLYRMGQEYSFTLFIEEDAIKATYGIDGYQTYYWANINVNGSDEEGHCIQTIKVPDAGPRS